MTKSAASRLIRFVTVIGSTRLGSLFLTLPTRGLTGQQVISSPGRRGGSFDHLVGEIEHARRNGEAQCLGRLEIDDQRIFRRVLNR